MQVFIATAASSIGIDNLDPSLCAALGPDIEYRLREIIQEAIKYVTRLCLLVCLLVCLLFVTFCLLFVSLITLKQLFFFFSFHLFYLRSKVHETLAKRSVDMS